MTDIHGKPETAFENVFDERIALPPETTVGRGGVAGPAAAAA